MESVLQNYHQRHALCFEPLNMASALVDWLKLRSAVLALVLATGTFLYECIYPALSRPIHFNLI